MNTIISVAVEHQCGIRLNPQCLWQSAAVLTLMACVGAGVRLYGVRKPAIVFDQQAQRGKAFDCLNRKRVCKESALPNP